MFVFCCGMRRSGGTLIYHLAKELAERSGRGQGLGFCPTIRHLYQLEPGNGLNVVKCHGYIPTPGKVIYSYRDLRDVAVSLIQMWGQSFEEVILDELPVVLARYYAWMNRPDRLVFRYETIRENIPSVVLGIADYLEIAITEAEGGEIAGRYDLDSQRQRIAAFDYGALPEVWMPEPSSLLHRNHIQSGKAGRWRSELAPDQVARLDEIYGDWLEANGYER